MSQYFVLSHVQVQNANSIAGLTWGFPAITHFLGFTHALNRKISSSYSGKYNTEFSGCGVVSHSVQNKVYQPKEFSDFEFIQSKNPPVLERHKKGAPPIIEEGKVNLEVSLVIELSKPLELTNDQIKQFEKYISALCQTMRIAGGSILSIQTVRYFSASTQEQTNTQIKKIKRLTMPGFALLDRSEYLQKHYRSISEEHKEDEIERSKPELLDAWLDFSALKFKAIAQLGKDQSIADENTPAEWEYVSKPFSGYLVPLMTGYKAISNVYDAGQVLNTRDKTTPTCFVEAVHSVGEWKSIHRIKHISDLIWRYQRDGQWYLCKQGGLLKTKAQPETTATQTLNFNEALNLF